MDSQAPLLADTHSIIRSDVTADSGSSISADPRSSVVPDTSDIFFEDYLDSLKRTDSRQSSNSNSSDSIQVPIVYVKALYDYGSSEPNALKFQKGEIISVFLQLETGWWDGQIDNRRGWFPSNYCEVVPRCDEHKLYNNSTASSGNLIDSGHGVIKRINQHLSPNNDRNDSYQLLEDRRHSDGSIRTSSFESLDQRGSYVKENFRMSEDHSASPSIMAARPTSRQQSSPPVPLDTKKEEVAYWIPQATVDGTVYYYNSITGQSVSDLPFETPSSTTETGPFDRNIVNVPENSMPPLDSDTSMVDYTNFTSFSPTDPLISPTDPLISPTGPLRSGSIRSKSSQWSTSNLQEPSSTNPSALTFSDNQPKVKSWDELLNNVNLATERFMDSLREGQMSSYISRIQAISDSVSLVVIAAGFPGFSVTQSDQDYYPHFRQVMSAMSKLSLSAHLWSVNSPPPNMEMRCLTETEILVIGITKFIQVAKMRLGEKICRLVPGFVDRSLVGGNWSGNGISEVYPIEKSIDPLWISDDFSYTLRKSVAPPIQTDNQFLETAEIQKAMIISSLREILKLLSVPYSREQVEPKLVKKILHVVNLHRNFFNLLEGLNLSPLTRPTKSPTITDYNKAKQNLYDTVAMFVLAGQELTGYYPHAKIKAKVEGLCNIVKELDKVTQSLLFIIQFLVEERELRVGTSSVSGLRHPSEASTDSSTSYFHSLFDQPSTSSTVYSPSGSKREQKIKKIFGDDVPGSFALLTKEREETPWFLGVEHEDEIIYDSTGHVKGGTLLALAERLTRHDFLDTSFNAIFLLTYRSFTTSTEFFEHLVKRFTIQPPDGLTRSEFDIWVERKQIPIRLRVFNVLKIWIEQFWLDMQEEIEDKGVLTHLLETVTVFALQISQQGFPGCDSLVRMVEQRLQGQEVTKKMVMNYSGSFPPPILPKNMKKIKFTYIDPLEMARQLTILESNLYGRIKPLECLNRAWNDRRGPDSAVNIKSLIRNSNHLTNWVAHMILTETDVKKRVNVITHFITIAEKCRQLNNFSSMTSIISALFSSTIHRLRRTWENVPQRFHTTLDSLNKLMNSSRNFGEYRAMLHDVNPPCVPFFGVYLTDLTFIEDGNTDMIRQSPNMINFSKRKKSAEVIREIQQYQSVPYLLEVVCPLQQFIQQSIWRAPAIDDMYDISLSIEPRERDDEKITRMLHDTGFL